MARKRSYNTMRALEQSSELEQAFSQQVEMPTETTPPAPSFRFSSRLDFSIDSSDYSDSDDESEGSDGGDLGNSPPSRNRGDGKQQTTPWSTANYQVTTDPTQFTTGSIQPSTGISSSSNSVDTATPTPSSSTFHPFPHLPPSLQRQIWLLAAPKPRTRILELHTYNTIDHLPRLVYHPPLPPLFSTCRDSRALSILHEGGEIVEFSPVSATALFGFHGEIMDTSDSDSAPTPSFYLNFARDIIWLPARFTAASNTTETSRLASLSTTLAPKHTSRIRRMLVSWSGEDSYDGIGPVLRPYARLETLYLCMNDWRVKERMKKLLRYEIVGGGEFAEKIRQVVQMTEDEETEDDEESEEVVKTRVAVRARRRIVEVDLRLGD